MPPRIPSPANMPPNKTSSKSRSSGVSHANHRFKKKGNGYNNNQKVSFDDVSDAAEFAADSSIFYVPSIEYAFSEQDASSGGYMTSEENHADEDTEDLSPQKVLILTKNRAEPLQLFRTPWITSHLTTKVKMRMIWISRISMIRVFVKI